MGLCIGENGLMRLSSIPVNTCRVILKQVRRPLLDCKTVQDAMGVRCPIEPYMPLDFFLARDVTCFKVQFAGVVSKYEPRYGIRCLRALANSKHSEHLAKPQSDQCLHILVYSAVFNDSSNRAVALVRICKCGADLGFCCHRTHEDPVFARGVSIANFKW